MLEKEIDDFEATQGNSKQLRAKLTKSLESLKASHDRLKNERAAIDSSSEYQTSLDTVNMYLDRAKKANIMSFAGIVIGHLLVIFGFIGWRRQADLQENLERNKIVETPLFSSECQSCLKTFMFFEERGTYQDGKKHPDYCLDCYKCGEFVEPELTLRMIAERLMCYKRVQRRFGTEKNIVSKLLKAKRWKRENKW